MVLHRPGEEAQIELETRVVVDDRTREMDLKLVGHSPNEKHTIAVEMKCYRKLASSGKPRAAQDIFRKDVYEDLALLEKYRIQGHADCGVSLVMTDHRPLVHLKTKEGKCHDYDISQDTAFDGIKINTPIGGKPMEIQLKGAYTFHWTGVGAYFFLEIEDRG